MVLAACGRIDFAAISDATTGSDAGVGTKSGSRLKLQWYQYTDGTEQLAGVFDAQRNEPCSFQTWADGNTYCVPTNLGTILYSDAACTQPVGEDPTSPQSCTGPGYFAASGPCGAAAGHIYQRGTTAQVSEYYELDATAGCSGPVVPDYERTFAGVGAEVAIGDFVEATITPPAGAGRIVVRSYETADGLALQSSLHDALLGLDCTPAVYQDQVVCQPIDLVTSTYATDATCTQPIVAEPNGCTPPSYAAAWPGTCEHLAPDYYTLGGIASPLSTYQASSGGCGMIATTGLDLYAIGAALLVATLDRAPDPLIAGHRMQLIHSTTTGASYLDALVYDSVLGVECTPSLASDGSLRCLPEGLAVGTGYAQAGCTSGLFDYTLDEPTFGCGAPAPPVYNSLALAGTTCSIDSEVHMGTTVYPQTIYFGSPAICIGMTGPAGTTFSVGAAVPPTTFAAATLITDP